MDADVSRIYGGKVRLRVCGMCWQNGKLLLVNHAGLRTSDFWAPPGGGVEFGSAISSNLSREFLEETGLQVEVGRFMFGCEFLHNPLHSVELFFAVSVLGGNLSRGSDPELQIIREVRFFAPEELRALDANELHGIFGKASTAEEFEKLGGFYRI